MSQPLSKPPAGLFLRVARCWFQFCKLPFLSPNLAFDPPGLTTVT